MSTTTVTDQVNHNVFVELITIIKSHLGHKQHGFRVVGVDMKNRRLNHFGDIRAVLRGTGVFPTAGGKANLVVDHDVNRATGAETTSLGHLEGFHDDALSGE